MPGDCVMTDALLARESAEIPDPWSLPLETLDVSGAELFRADRHGEYFRRLRLEDPVHYCPESPYGPYWSLTKFNDIVAAELDYQSFSSNRDIVIGDQPEDFASMSFIQMDPPRHDAHRLAAQPAVSPSRLQELEGLIRGRVEKILDDVPVGEPINWVEHVSKELTTQMLATLFDLPFADRHLLPYWSDVTTSSELVGNTSMTEEERKAELMRCLAYFSDLWRERAKQPPKFDFISLLAHNPHTRDLPQNPMEFLGTLMLLIVGGNDTTRNSISGGVVFLNQNPDEYEKLHADPTLTVNMVSEIIRYQTPLAHMRRTAARDTEFGGKAIRRGEKVILWYVSGNRDEEAIDQPDRFIIDRSSARHHVSFGFGIHRCMGNRVAEMQLRLLWEEIQRRYKRVELVGAPERVLSNFVLGYTDVPVVVHPR